MKTGLSQDQSLRKNTIFDNIWRSTARNATVTAVLLLGGAVWAGPATIHLPKDVMLSDSPAASPVNNAAFAPAADELTADRLHVTVTISQTKLDLDRELAQPVCDGRPVNLGGSCRGGEDKRRFPAISLELFSFDNDTMLGSAQIGQMIAEAHTSSDKRSYWQVIPQYGRVWKEPADEGWSRAAFPIMLVHSVENVAHQGLATFLYKGDEISDVRMQFIQQSTPWNTPTHFIAWGVAESHSRTIDDPESLTRKQVATVKDIRHRVEARPWNELEKQYPAGALDGFGGPLKDKWIVMNAAVKDGIVYTRIQIRRTARIPIPRICVLAFGQ
jgi:hypothetical protein